MPFLKLRQPDSLLLNRKTANIIAQYTIKGNFILKRGKNNNQFESPDCHYLELRVEWTGGGKTLALALGKRNLPSSHIQAPNNPSAAFVMSSESQLKSLIRSSQGAEIKMKGKGYMRHSCP